MCFPFLELDLDFVMVSVLNYNDRIEQFNQHVYVVNCGLVVVRVVVRNIFNPELLHNSLF